MNYNKQTFYKGGTPKVSKTTLNLSDTCLWDKIGYTDHFLVCIDDLYQRQPLLPAAAKADDWSQNDEYLEAPEDELLRKHDDNSNGIVKINMPAPVREEPKFPQEKWKTVIGKYYTPTYCYMMQYDNSLRNFSFQSVTALLLDISESCFETNIIGFLKFYMFFICNFCSSYVFRDMTL